jgi:uncharacterized Zn finger protein
VETGGVKETIPEKAARLLSSGCVHVQRADGARVAAIVQGDTGRWIVAGDGEGRWACSCPAWKGCSHIAAAELVTTQVVAA